MALKSEIRDLELGLAHLKTRVDSLAAKSSHDEDDRFLAESIAFRLYRLHEKILRSFFLECCVKTRTISNNKIRSKLRCTDWSTAEGIIKSGERFFEWGKTGNVKRIANLIFEDGYPVVDFINVNSGVAADLQRIRNFIAHDSEESYLGFKKAAGNYLRTGEAIPSEAGSLLLHRKTPVEPNTLSKIFIKLEQYPTILRSF